MMSASNKNVMEMQAQRDFSFSAPVRRRYAILCSPRSGSTLLSRALYKSQVAGDPLEYLNKHLLAQARLRYEDPKMGYSEFIRKAESSRTSMNGLFGIQLHYSQFVTAISSEAHDANYVSFLKRFDKFLWVRRKDKIAQAVSFAIAKKSRAWSSEDVSITSLSCDDFSTLELMKALRVVVGDDLGWQALTNHLSLQAEVLWYEDMVENFGGSVNRALRHIGAAPNAMTEGLFPMQKQSMGLNLELRSKLVQFLGC